MLVHSTGELEGPTPAGTAARPERAPAMDALRHPCSLSSLPVLPGYVTIRCKYEYGLGGSSVVTQTVFLQAFWEVSRTDHLTPGMQVIAAEQDGSSSLALPCLPHVQAAAGRSQSLFGICAV